MGLRACNRFAASHAHTTDIAPAVAGKQFIGETKLV